MTLTRDDLLSLEEYDVQRNGIRAEVMEHKRLRKIHLGEHATLYFEDATTIRYQILEMLRIEKIFNSAGIQEELDAYNPLIPDGNNFKATFMLEYEDVEERKTMLGRLRGVEDKVWVQIDGFDKVWALADQDMERENDDKTSAVHFMQWDLEPAMVQAARDGASIHMGIYHPAYMIEDVELAPEQRDSLAADLTQVTH